MMLAIKTKKMNTTTLTQGQELRNQYPELHNVIFFDGKPLATEQKGAINSKGGVVLIAWCEELNANIFHRSSNNHGWKGFSLNDNDYPVTSEIRKRLEYKY